MKAFKESCILLLIFTIVTGVLYPVSMALLGMVFFPEQVAGSLIRDKNDENKIYGSYLLGQKTEDPHYFWPRPAASDYELYPAGASNWGPTAKDLLLNLQKRSEEWSKTGAALPPVEMLFASGSGLDPHISVASVEYQLPRVQEQRHLDAENLLKLRQLIKDATSGPTMGFLGQERVNVLQLNLSMDQNNL